MAPRHCKPPSCSPLAPCQALRAAPQAQHLLLPAARIGFLQATAQRSWKEVGGGGQRSCSDLELQESALGTGSALPGPAITQIPLADLRELSEATGRSTRMITWTSLCLPSLPPPHFCHLDPPSPTLVSMFYEPPNHLS